MELHFEHGKPFKALDVVGIDYENEEFITTDVSIYFRSPNYRRFYDNNYPCFFIQGKAVNYYVRDFTEELEEKHARDIAIKHFKGLGRNHRLD
jgi:hypothetical protein